MNEATHTKQPLAYSDFYNEVFLPEHSQPMTVVTHVLGTALGLLWVIACLAFGHYFWLLLFPVVHHMNALS